MGYIYKITSPSGKFYVGQTNDLRKRINAHRNSMKRKWTHVILINSFKKYGFDEHLFEILEECDDRDLDEKEKFWIKELKSFYAENEMGMNMTIGGEGHTGFNPKDENRKAILLKNLYSKGKNPFLGRTHTEENKKYLSELMSKRNKEKGITIPHWGAVKGWESVMRKVIAYGNDGKMIGEFKSLTEAANQLNVKLGGVKDSVLKKRWVGGKYKFIYKENYVSDTIPTDDIRFKDDRKPVLAFDMNMKFLGEFAHAEDAEKVLGVPKGTIRRAAAYNNLRPIRKGFIFVYKEDYHSSIPSEMEGGDKPLI
jgi:group I intron endonuclease